MDERTGKDIVLFQDATLTSPAGNEKKQEDPPEHKPNEAALKTPSTGTAMVGLCIGFSSESFALPSHI
jgi:hypothetical protein